MPPGEISKEAHDYINTRDDVMARLAATNYAGMDDGEFRARLGPAVDSHDETLKKINRTLEEISDFARLVKPGLGGGPITAAARWSEQNNGRRALAWLAITGAVLAIGNQIIQLWEALATMQ